eukprot:13076149-Alexandrium_andersonii.AAC.1
MATRTSPELDWGSIWTVVRAERRSRIDNVRGGRGKHRVARKLPLFVAPTVALKCRHPQCTPSAEKHLGHSRRNLQMGVAPRARALRQSGRRLSLIHI